MGTLLKPLRWVGSSKGDLRRFPDAVQDCMGFAIYQAQIGLRHRDAKLLKGFGPGILEVAARHGGDTYRAIYTVRFQAAVYVLHAFQKKAKRGIATPKKELDLVRQRLRIADRDHRGIQGRG
ncbi:MAG: type II toxin-antitoxin system RelE/ParE family toxin [Gammaproteobacteria bacterium]|nr:type II toxin-antitoxin system RelE/ParE family toxin [Gammaproteobacteria bacterium]